MEVCKWAKNVAVKVWGKAPLINLAEAFTECIGTLCNIIENKFSMRHQFVDNGLACESQRAKTCHCVKGMQEITVRHEEFRSLTLMLLV